VTEQVVSTEDAEIESIARQLDVRVVARPVELATDTAPSAPVIKHALDVIEDEDKRRFDYVLTLQPTTPFRLGVDIDAAVGLLDEIDEGGASVTSIVRVLDRHPARAKRLENGRLVDYCVPDREGTRRQDLPAAYVRNGAIYVARRNVIESGSVWGRVEYPYEMPPERSINIDEPLDFLLAEAVLHSGLVRPDLAGWAVNSR
jgi:CMP-N-acetylneuraminic acid synthetase